MISTLKGFENLYKEPKILFQKKTFTKGVKKRLIETMVSERPFIFQLDDA